MMDHPPPHLPTITLNIIRIAEILLDGMAQIQPADDSWYKQLNLTTQHHEDDDHDPS